MELGLSTFMSGLALGGVFSLTALGLVLAFRATEVFNFAHGQFMLIPAFLLGKWQTEGTAPLWVSLLVGLGVTSLVSIAFYYLVLRKMVGQPLFMAIIATLGLAAILDGVISIAFGSDQYKLDLPGLPTGATTILGARLSDAQIALTVFSLCLAIGVAAFLGSTHFGTKIRAAGQDAVLASQGGIRVHRVYVVSWIAAAVLAGVAGITFGGTNVVNGSIVDLSLLAFPAMLLGGLDSISGAIVGGVIVGMVQAVTATYLGGEYVNAVTYGLLLLVLLFLPQGLYGSKVVARV